jgi:hypothetical protein
MFSSSSCSGSEEGTAYFYKCKRCRIKFHEDYIILPDKMCNPCLKLSKYVCKLCESTTAGCTPWNCTQRYKICDQCDNAYHEDHISNGICDRCEENNSY